MKPCSNQDWRPTHARKAMHQQVSSPDAYRHREHNVLKLLRRDRARIWDWDVDVGDFRSSVNGLFPAERNDGCDALRIGPRQLLCIFEAAQVEPFPNPRHLPPCLGLPRAWRPASHRRQPIERLLIVLDCFKSRQNYAPTRELFQSDLYAHRQWRNYFRSLWIGQCHRLCERLRRGLERTA